MKKTIKEYKEQLYVLEICLVAVGIVAIMIAGVNLFFPTDNNSDVGNTNCINPCNFITSTPSWIKDGYLLGSGFVPNLTTEMLINDNITFVYRDGCGWCDEQKKILDMNLLNKSGLLLKC